MTATKLKKLFPGVKLNFPISTVTTFAVGGRVFGYLLVTTPERFVQAVQMAEKNKLKYLIIAGGSNVVFPDKKLNRLIIHFYTPEAKSLLGRTTICSNASQPLASLINAAIEAGLGGIETLSGIPGTVGGAIVGNAGAYGQSISDKLMSVEIFDGKKLRVLSKEECKFHYRDSVFKHKNWLVLRAYFELEKGDKKALAKKSKEIIKIREKKYKSGLKCPGSYFKNVLVKDVSKKSFKLIDQSKIIGGKIPAGYLLQEVGAYNLKKGKASVASFHGNLIMNNGKAKYKDVKALADLLKKRVKKKFGITLEEEVRYML